MQPSTHRLPELDGVRGLAILIVMFHHTFLTATSLSKNTFFAFLTKFMGIGWVCVDIFFVLSGFLITTILLNTRHQPNYFKNFYARRILRILPLYFLMIGGVFLFLPLLMPKTVSGERESWPYFLFFLQNWLLIPSFDLGPFPLMIAQSWSLAIEEQFYLVWPTLLFFLSRKKVVYLSMMIVILSLAVRFILWKFGGTLYSSPQFLYFSSFTRFDGFAVGALIAVAFQSAYWKRIFSYFAWPFLVISLTTLIVMMIGSGTFAPGYGNEYMNIWGYSLSTLASGALIVILSTGTRQAPLSIFFRNRILLFFGKHSYAIYLIHYPMMLILLDRMQDANAQGGKDWLIFVFLTSAFTILGSLLTWYLLEQPMLKLKKYFEYKAVGAVGTD